MLSTMSPDRAHPTPRGIPTAIREFLRLESAGGILLAIATLLALVLANTRGEALYDAFLDTPVAIQIGQFKIAKPLLLWVNDGLMAVFFFVVGLELKREALEGELSNPAQIVLPAVAAVGGMIVPAAIFAWFNWTDPVAMRGWAIPTATDIAFALGVLSLLGPRVPNGLKVFLLTLAILDDLGAIVIIAIFYTESLSVTSLAAAATAIAVLFAMNRSKIVSITPYLFVGLVLWVAVLKSGVHATLAGVIVAFFIPIRNAANPDDSPLRRLEHDLHPAVAFGILPLFAFANAGVSLKEASLATLFAPVPLGIAAGLVLGKTVGIIVATFIAVRAGWARVPTGANWMSMFGVAVLCGIGFTMSVFIAGLAFGDDAPKHAIAAVTGVLMGSLAAAVIGYLILAAALPRQSADTH
jgi:Na+:H+ antiporter, NhaA family